MNKIYLIILCALVVACSPEGQAQKSNTVPVKIANRTFNIPRVYVDMGRNSNLIENSVVLTYVLPGFEPEPPHPQERAKRKELILAGRMRGMLLEEAAARPSIDTMVLNILRNNKHYKNKPTENIYGLEKYASVKIEPDVATQYDDLFIERDKEGMAISFLFCSPPEKDKVPGCSHKFIDKGLLYQIRWKISELPNWKSQRQAAIKFIDSFEIQ